MIRRPCLQEWRGLARQRFGITAEHLHIDTTSLSVSGDYAASDKQPAGEEEAVVPIAITYGYSRDHRADLQQWMMALATTHDGDVPVFMRPLDGNSSDKKSLSEMVLTVMTQLRDTLTGEAEESLAVFDSGGYSEANMKRYNEANIRWISRVPETCTEAKKAVQEEPGVWQQLADGSGE
jgi:transposase